MTKPSSSCRDDDSCPSEVKEVRCCSYRATRSEEGGGRGWWMGQQNDFNTGDCCLFPELLSLIPAKGVFLFLASLQSCKVVHQGVSVLHDITVGCGYGCNRVHFWPHPSVMLDMVNRSPHFNFSTRKEGYLELHNRTALQHSLKQLKKLATCFKM